MIRAVLFLAMFFGVPALVALILVFEIAPRLALMIGMAGG